MSFYFSAKHLQAENYALGCHKAALAASLNEKGPTGLMACHALSLYSDMLTVLLDNHLCPSVDVWLCAVLNAAKLVVELRADRTRLAVL